MKLKIINERAASSELYLLLTGDKINSLQGLTANKSVLFSDFVKNNPAMEIDIDSIEGARLYVGYGTFPDNNAPIPDGDQYYGWIEFTKKATGSVVWINLSNVDITGLPVILSGTDSQNQPFTLGYKKSIVDIIAAMKSSALVPSTTNNEAYITCATGQIKVVGPNGKPDCYASYDTYINMLATNKAPLVITSDTPKGGQPKIFTGSFLNAVNDDDPIISLTSAQNDTFIVKKGQFTTEICYRCDGGTLVFNGKTVNQNQSPQLTDDQLYANSTFRNILIGINEGYFTKTGPNQSINFPGDIPFATGEGSSYAKILHENSNSYGFPYADSNLKVLITADPSQVITMTLCEDNVAKGYNGNTDNSSNQPTTGDFQMGIGAGSDALGTITIDNWRYLPTEAGAYGGFLPTVNDWTKMHFSGPNTYIWFKTTENGFVYAEGCFNNTPTFINKVLIWGADVAWNSGVPSPSKPQ